MATLYSVLVPTFRVTGLFGLTPFRIDARNCNASKINLAWSLICMTFVGVYAFTAVIQVPAIHNGMIAEITSILDAYTGQACICFGYLFACIFNKDTVTVLQTINSFDQSLKTYVEIDLEKEYKTVKNYAIVALVVTITFVSLIVTNVTYNDLELFTFELFGEYIIYTAPYVINSFVALQFSTIVLLLKQRFRWLNNKIVTVSRNLRTNLDECNYNTKKNRVRPTTHVIANGFAQDKALFLLERIRSDHYRLCTISQAINKIYAVPILTIVLQSFMTIIVSFYYSGRYIIVDNTIPIDYMIYSGLQLLLAVIQLLTLVTVCSVTTLEAKNAGVIIHQITGVNRHLENKWKEELQLEITFFSLQLLNHNVKFTACNVFELDETLIFSIVGAVTTYLIIVIQFEAGNVKKA